MSTRRRANGRAGCDMPTTSLASARVGDLSGSSTAATPLESTRALAMLLSLSLLLAPRAPPIPLRAGIPHANLNLPIDGVKGVDMTVQLGALTFSEVTSVGRDAEEIMSGKLGTSVGPEAVTVGLYYGELTTGDAKGTRVLIKAYSSEANNKLAAARASLITDGGGGEAAAMARMRERLEASMKGTAGSDDDTSAAVASLEAMLSGAPGISLAEALAENEYAAHSRVQASVKGDIERDGSILKLLGRQVPEYKVGEEAVILSVFPWRGEQVRMARAPTRLPPTLASWTDDRAKGKTLGGQYDASVPRQGMQQRGRFVRSALFGALTGLNELHKAGMLHQSLGPSAVLLSTDDDRIGDKAKGYLSELSFCRDARSLEPVYRAGPDGYALPAYQEARDVMDTGLLERALRKTVRPGDPEERARFGRADDMREFGMLLLQCALIPNMGPEAPLDPLRLRTLCDGSFRGSDEGLPTDGVDVNGLRAFLDAEEGLRLGGVGGVELLDVGGPGKSGWDLLEKLLAPVWEDRPTSEEALKHPWWKERMFF